MFTEREKRKMKINDKTNRGFYIFVFFEINIFEIFIFRKYLF